MNIPISVVFIVMNCESGQIAPTIFIRKSQNAPNVARRHVHVRRGQASCGPRGRLWDLPLFHLSPWLRVIPCEYADYPYIAKN